MNDVSTSAANILSRSRQSANDSVNDSMNSGTIGTVSAETLTTGASNKKKKSGPDFLRTNKEVGYGRWFVVLGLLAVAGGLVGLALFLSKESQRSVAQGRFESIAERALVIASLRMEEKKYSADALAYMASTAGLTAEVWPNVVISNYHLIATSLRNVTQGEEMIFGPIVRPGGEEQTQFEEFVNTQKQWNFPSSNGNMHIWSKNPETDEKYHDKTGETNWDSPYKILVPAFQINEGPEHPHSMFNLHSYGPPGKVMDSVIECAMARAASNRGGNDERECGSLTDFVYKSSSSSSSTEQHDQEEEMHHSGHEDHHTDHHEDHSAASHQDHYATGHDDHSEEHHTEEIHHGGNHNDDHSEHHGTDNEMHTEESHGDHNDNSEHHATEEIHTEESHVDHQDHSEHHGAEEMHTEESHHGDHNGHSEHHVTEEIHTEESHGDHNDDSEHHTTDEMHTEDTDHDLDSQHHHTEEEMHSEGDHIQEEAGHQDHLEEDAHQDLVHTELHHHTEDGELEEEEHDHLLDSHPDHEASNHTEDSSPQSSGSTSFVFLEDQPGHRVLLGSSRSSRRFTEEINGHEEENHLEHLGHGTHHEGEGDHSEHEEDWWNLAKEEDHSGHHGGHGTHGGAEDHSGHQGHDMHGGEDHSGHQGHGSTEEDHSAHAHGHGGGEWAGPEAYFLIPVYPQMENARLTGFIVAKLVWEEVLAHGFASDVTGLSIVLKTSTQQVHTFDVTDGIVTHKGEGDHHDPHALFEMDFVINNAKHYHDETVRYHMTIYSTDAFLESYESIQSWIFVVAAIILVPVLLFFVYDFVVRREFNSKKNLMEAKRQFVRVVSHEVRTPLNTVCMGLTLLRDELTTCLGLRHKTGKLQDSGATLTTASMSGNSNEEQLEDWLMLSNQISENAEAAVNVLSDLLNYDKIQMGTLALELTAVPIWSLIENTFSEFKIAALEKKIKFVLDFGLLVNDGNGDLETTGAFTLAESRNLPVDLRACIVVGDTIRLSQVLRNLISNGLKFTKEKGVLKIRVSEKAILKKEQWQENVSFDDDKKLLLTRRSRVVIDVMDDGVGMTPEQTKKVFQDGTQFNANKLQSGGGTGLGLNIAKGIAVQHSGSLKCSSAGLGKGTTFTLSLPLYQVDSSPEEIRDNFPEIVSELKPQKMQSEEFTCSALDSHLQILVVDDSAMNRKLCMRLLEKRGHICTGAEDGAEALEIFRQHSEKTGEEFDCILLDYEMPKLKGPDACAELRKMGCSSFIVGVTGNVMSEDVQLFRSCGANWVLSKPFRIEALEQQLVENGVMGSDEPVTMVLKRSECDSTSSATMTSPIQVEPFELEKLDA